jgi:hypothetical protein
MIRPLLVEVAIFLSPFALYVAFLFATRAGIFHPESWPLKRVIVLSIVAVLLTATSLFLFFSSSGAPPGSAYTPAHMENGKLVPGVEK